MQINFFKAYKVYDYCDYEWEFHQQLNFITGINGSGKTNAIKLLQAMLKLDLEVLISIPFETAEIEVKHQNKTYCLKINKPKNNNNNTMIEFDLNGEKYNYSDDAFMLIRLDNDLNSSYLEHESLNFIRELPPLFHEYLKIKNTLFLGLERTSYISENLESYDFISTQRSIKNILASRKKIIEGLENCLVLIRRSYQNYRRKIDIKNQQLPNLFVKSSFDIMDVNHMFKKYKKLEHIQMDIENINRKKEEILRLLNQPSIEEDRKNNFFNFLDKFGNMKEDEFNQNPIALIEWIVNASEVNRLLNIVKDLDSLNSEALEKFKPIQDFLQMLNKFISQSHKTAEINNVGDLVIKRTTEKRSTIKINQLSSGEKQLLILLTHAAFSFINGSSRRNVFIIDEPELSLHIHWQEMLVPALMEHAPNNQFIFATHSPEIIGEYAKPEHCLYVKQI